MTEPLIEEMVRAARENNAVETLVVFRDGLFIKVPIAQELFDSGPEAASTWWDLVQSAAARARKERAT